MPVITFTDADVASTILLDKGYYSATVKEISAPTASSSGKSVSYWTTFEIAEGKAKGKELKVAFNSGTQNQSLLGTMQFFPMSAMIGLYQAVMNVKLDPDNKNIDTDMMINTPFDLGVGVETVDGQLINTVTGWLPYQAGQKGGF